MELDRRFKYAQIGICVWAGLTLCGLGAKLPMAVDWTGTFRPAALSMWRTGNPYTNGFYNPPWAILPLLPLALLPETWGRGVLIVVSLLSFAYTAKRLGASPLAMALILLSPLVVLCVQFGNIDWLVVLGFVLPPPVALFFLVAKPQVGLVMALYYAVRAWQERKLIETVAPVTIALLLSFLVYGFWPAQATGLVAQGWNTSLWPYSIPVGIALTVAAVRKREYAMAASPCLSPYVAPYSWIGVLFALCNSVPELAAAVVGLWILIAVLGLA